MSTLQPIVHYESGHSRKLAHIGAHQYGLDCQCMGGNKQVIRTNGLAVGGKVLTDFRISLIHRRVIGEHIHGRDNGVHLFCESGRIVLCCAIP